MNACRDLSVDSLPPVTNGNGRRVDILGVRVRPLDLAQTVNEVERVIRDGERTYGVFINVYNVIEARSNAGVLPGLERCQFPHAGWDSAGVGEPGAARPRTQPGVWSGFSDGNEQTRR